MWFSRQKLTMLESVLQCKNRCLMSYDGKTWPSKFFLEKMREGCFQTRLAFVSRLTVSCHAPPSGCPLGWLWSLGVLGLAVRPGVVSDGGVLSAGDRLALVRTAQIEPSSSWSTQVPFLCLDLSQASGEHVLEVMATHLCWKIQDFHPWSQVFQSWYEDLFLWLRCWGRLILLMCLYIPVQNRFLRLRSYQLLSCSSKPPRLRQVMDCLCIFKPNQCVFGSSFSKSSYPNCFVGSEASHH